MAISMAHSLSRASYIFSALSHNVTNVMDKQQTRALFVSATPDGNISLSTNNLRLFLCFIVILVLLQYAEAQFYGMYYSSIEVTVTCNVVTNRVWVNFHFTDM